MPASGWYIDNENRDFPFLRGSGAVPYSAIVDCGFMLGDYAGFEPGEHSIYLVRIIRTAPGFRFIFGSDAPGMADQQLVFDRLLNGPRFVIEYSDGQTISGDPDLTLCSTDDVLRCSGYLVTGELTALAALLPDVDDAIVPDDPLVVEPALIRSLRARSVASISVANADRTRYQSPAQCRPVCQTFDVAPIYVRQTCLTGPLRFKEGFNSKIQVNTFANSITFNATEGGGEGGSCDDLELTAEEMPPHYRTTLDGGLRCDEVVTSINGVGGEQVSIRAGRGVSVMPLSPYNRIIIDVSGRDLAACLDIESKPATAIVNVPSDDDCAPGLLVQTRGSGVLIAPGLTISDSIGDIIQLAGQPTITISGLSVDATGGNVTNFGYGNSKAKFARPVLSASGTVTGP